MILRTFFLLKAIVALFALLFFMPVCAQKITIGDVTNAILSKSYDRQLLTAQGQQNNIRYTMFTKSVLPQVIGVVNFPNFNRSITEIILPDGSKALREQNAASESFSLSISQKVPFTGGRLSIDNMITRLDQFGFNRSTNYSGSWLNVNYSQPLVSFNEYKYDQHVKKLENKLFDLNQSKTLYNLYINVADIYWDVVLLRKRMDAIRQGQELFRSIRSVLTSRLIERRILAVDTLEIAYQQKQYEFELSNITSQLSMRLRALNSFGSTRMYNATDVFEPVSIEDDILSATIDTLELIYAIRRDASLKSKIDSLQYGKTVKLTKIQRLPQFNISSNLGYNNSNPNFSYLFDNPAARMGLNFSITIPIVAWESGKRTHELAKYALEEALLKNKIKEKQEINDAVDIIGRRNLIQSEIKLLEVQQKNIDEQLKIYALLLTEKDVSIETINRILIRKTEIETDIYGKYKQLYLMTLQLKMLMATH